ncbi:MAG: glycosyltransferase [Bacteroidetes bacterium]|nr:glycosyltransferase [Bacteroidota bacterium]
MKIAYLSTFYPYRGGIAQFNASLYRELEKHAEIRAFTFTRQYPDLLFPGQTQLIQKGDPADPIQADRCLDTINPVSWYRTARLIASWKPDVLVMKFWMPFFGPSLGFVAGYLKKRGVRVVTILDNVIPHERRPGDLTLIRYFLNRSSAFIAMTATVRDDLLRLKPDARHVVKAHPVYDHFPARMGRAEARRQLGLDPDSPMLLFFGFIRGYKGLDVLIEALPETDSRIGLMVAGEVYGSFEAYQEQIDRLQLGSRIYLYHHYIPDTEVAVYFSAADVVVLPYRSATQSGIVQIAYHYQLPVIVTAVGGLTEMVTDGVTGLVIPPGNPGAVADAIRRFFENHSDGQMEREIAARAPDFSWSGFAGELLALARS